LQASLKQKVNGLSSLRSKGWRGWNILINDLSILHFLDVLLGLTMANYFHVAAVLHGTLFANATPLRVIRTEIIIDRSIS
jgi:hypothetical protein